MLKVGLVINPYAGIGGRVGLKGSDGAEIREQALNIGGTKLSIDKAKLCFMQFEEWFNEIKVYTAAGEMGEQLCIELKIEHQVVTYPINSTNLKKLINSENSNKQLKPFFTSAKDTKTLVSELCKLNLDIILFVGGDGTARDVCNVVMDDQLVLGIPAGVKIHSGVYSVSPEAAGKLMRDLVLGKMVAVQQAGVVDLNEEAFRVGHVKTKYYGEMSVPTSQVYMQSTKQGSGKTEAIELIDIAADIIEGMQDNIYYIIGSGSTCAMIMDELGIKNTLLGSDVIFNQELYLSDATEIDLLQLLKTTKKMIFILTFIGGQGHLLGRGNHQVSPEVIKQSGWDSFKIIATKSKLSELQGRPLQVDTGDIKLDHQLFGLKKITTGYHDTVLYTVGFEC